MSFANLSYSDENASQTEAHPQNPQPPASIPPPPIIVKISTPDKLQVETKTEKHEADEQAALNEKLVCYTLWLAIVTTILAFFTFFLWLATWSLSRDARNTSKIENRPLLALKDVQFGDLYWSNTDLKLQISATIINIGRLPAIGFRPFAKLRFRTGPITTASVSGDQENWRTSSRSEAEPVDCIFPGADQSICQPFMTIIMNDELMEWERNHIVDLDGSAQCSFGFELVIGVTYQSRITKKDAFLTIYSYDVSTGFIKQRIKDGIYPPARGANIVRDRTYAD